MNIKETSKTYKDKKIEKIDINQYFDTNGNFYKLWKNKYSKLEYPIYINKLFEIEYEDFKKLDLPSITLRKCINIDDIDGTSKLRRGR